MQVKTLEIRDEGTFIAALAVDMNPVQEMPEAETLEQFRRLQRDYEARRYLLRRCGYPCDGRPNVILTRLDGNGRATNDPYAWGDRTWATAHNYIIEHWDELRAGDVIDVQFILGETATPKVSERITVGGLA